MGWTTMAMPREGARAYLDAHVYSWANETGRHKVIDSALIGNREYHAAVESTALATGVTTVFAGVALVSVSHARNEFGYKDMCEDVGPYYFNAPLRILDKLTLTENEAALEWRASCRAAAAARSAIARKPKLMPGQRVRFDEPIKFTDGAELREFDVRQNHRSGRGVAFVDPRTGKRYAIPKASARAFIIVGND